MQELAETNLDLPIKSIRKQDSAKQDYYYKDENFYLYNDDCLEVMKKLPDNYVDMIFADPPYMLSNNGFTCQAGKMVSVNKGRF